MKRFKEGQPTNTISIYGTEGFRKTTRLTPEMESSVPALFTVIKDGVPHVLSQALAQMRLDSLMTPRRIETGNAWTRKTKSGIHRGPGRYSR